MKDNKREYKGYSAMMWIEELNKRYEDYKKLVNDLMNQDITKFERNFKLIFDSFFKSYKLRRKAEENEQGNVALIALGYESLYKEFKIDWERFSASDKSFVLAFKPEYAKYFNDWDKLYSFNWQFLLERQPQFIKEAEKHISGWAAILSIKPELFNKHNNVQKFSKDDWFTLLQSQPQFIKHCPYIAKFNKFEKQRLIRKQPTLYKIILGSV